MSSSDNQPGPLASYNIFSADPVLSDAVSREGGDIALLESFGERVGGEEIREWGRLANKNVPILHTHDPFGERIDEVEFHPAYHSMLGLAVESGICLLYTSPSPRDGLLSRMPSSA